MKKLTLILTLTLLLIALAVAPALAEDGVVITDPSGPIPPPVIVHRIAYHVGNDPLPDQDASGTGWEWDYDAQNPTLTLTDYEFSDELTEYGLGEVIWVPEGTTIILEGESVLIADEGVYAAAILCGELKVLGHDSIPGKLTIRGPGSLTAVVSKTGIEAGGEMTVDDQAKLDITLMLAPVHGGLMSTALTGIKVNSLGAQAILKINDDSEVNINYAEIEEDEDEGQGEGNWGEGQVIPFALDDGPTEIVKLSATTMTGLDCEGQIVIDDSRVKILLGGVDIPTRGICGYVAYEPGEYGLNIRNGSNVYIEATDTGIRISPSDTLKRNGAGEIEAGGGVYIHNSTVKSLVPEEIPESLLSSYHYEGIAGGFGILSGGDIYIEGSDVDATGYSAGIYAKGSVLYYDSYPDDKTSRAGYEDPIFRQPPTPGIQIPGEIVIRGDKVVDVYRLIGHGGFIPKEVVSVPIDGYSASALTAQTAPTYFGVADGIYGAEKETPGMIIAIPTEPTEYLLGATFSETADSIVMDDQKINDEYQKKYEEIDDSALPLGEKGKQLEALARETHAKKYADFAKNVQLRTSREVLETVTPLLMAVGKSFPFVDIGEGHWAYPFVFEAYKKALINGKTDILFMPDGDLTYAEAIKLAACANQLYSMNAVSFEPSYPWYETYVNYAQLNQIIDQGQFSGKMEQAINRYDFALIFSRALPATAYAPIKAVDSIPDVPASNSYYSAVLKLYQAAILTGDSNGAFNGKSNIKRSEAAAILIRLIDPEKRK